MRGKWTYDTETGKIVDYVEKPRPVINAPAIRNDTVELFLSHADAKYYTSLSKYRRSLKELGFMEIGNETEALHKAFEKDDKKTDTAYQEQLLEDITRAYYQVRDGEAPLSEFDKERCKIMNRQLKENLDRREYDTFGELKK